MKTEAYDRKLSNITLGAVQQDAVSLNTVLPDQYENIQNILTTPQWASTCLLPPQQVCNIIIVANVALVDSHVDVRSLDILCVGLCNCDRLCILVWPYTFHCQLVKTNKVAATDSRFVLDEHVLVLQNNLQ